MLTDQDLAILAIADGNIPAGVDPDSPKGLHYARLIAAIKADMATAPPMSAETKARVAVLLRGGAA